MKRFATVVLTACLSLTIASPALARQAQLEFENQTEAQLAAGNRARVIVTFSHTPPAADAPVSDAADRALMASITEQREAVFARVFAASSAELAAGEVPEARLHRSFDYTPAAAMYLTREEIAALAADPGVLRIETDGLERASLDGSVTEIGAAALHAAGIDGTGSTIAVLDTGIDYDHPAFTGRIVASACFSSTVAENSSLSACAGSVSSDTSSPQAANYCFDEGSPLSACFHGTHVASIAAGASGPGYIYDGVAPGAGLVPIQVFSEFSGNTEACRGQQRCVLSYVSDQIAALEWVYANRETLGVTVVNMSLGGAAESGSCNSDPRTGIIYQLKVARIATITAAGNEGARGQMGPPACITHSISVAARGINGEIAPFSNISILTRLVAPGEAISAAGPSTSAPPVSTQSGTSMAAPHVAGAYAVAQSLFPSLSPDQILIPLIHTGTPVVWDPNRPAVGAIRLDLAMSALSAQYGSSGDISVSPTGGITIYGPPGPGSAMNGGRFTITNNGQESQNWTVHSNASWLTFATAVPDVAQDVAPVLQGTIAPGETVTITAQPAGDFTEGLNDAVAIFRVGDQVFPRPINIQISEERPPNDFFANAMPIGEYQYYYDVSLAHASLEPGETHPDGATNSIWFYFVPDGTQAYVLSTSARSSGVYAAGPGNLEAHSLVTNVGDVINSRRDIRFEGTAGQRVYIALADPNLAEVDFKIDDSPTTNTVASSPFEAIRLEEGGGRIERRTRFTTRPPADEPTHDQSFAHRAWFVWTAPYTGVFSLTDRELGTNRQTTFAIFRRTDGADIHTPDDSWDLLEPIGRLTMAENTPEGTDDRAERELRVDVTEGQTYWIRIGSDYSSTWRFSYGAPRNDLHALRAAVLPNSRRVLYGEVGSAFMTVINPASFGTPVTNCRILPGNIYDAAVFEYRFTNGQNEPFGAINPRFDLAPGGSQSFVFTLRGSVPGVLRPVWNFYCDNVVPIQQPRGADEIRIWSATDPGADIITIAATPSGNGILDLPSSGTRAFAVAAVNIGTSMTELELEPAAFSSGAGARTEICETNPNTGACISPRGPRVVIANFAANQVRTFSVFVITTDFNAGFDPTNNRIRVEFRHDDVPGRMWGSTSVAYRTQ